MRAFAKYIGKAIVPPSLQGQIRDCLALPLRIARLERQMAILARHEAHEVYGADRIGAKSGSGLNPHELQVYSQHGEDGILQFIFSEIGVLDKTFVEFGMGDGRECNTAYLSLHCGWRGLLMDGNPERAAAARAFYERNLGPNQDAVTVAKAWITAENINEILRQHGQSGEIDLLSIDMDGIDYWVWRAIDAVKPRVIVVEYSAVLGWERRVTVPNDPRFSRWDKHASGLYAGASLSALEALGREKGYRLVGCESHGINAFFVREDLVSPVLPEVSPEAAYFHGDDLVLGLITPERFTEVAHLDWETV